MPELTCLTFRSLSDIRVAFAAELIDSLATHSPHLSQLTCDLGDSFEDFPFSQLNRFANLNQIKLLGIGKIQEPIDSIFPSKLTELELDRVEFDAGGMPALLSTLPNLHTLTLKRVSSLSSFEGWFSRSVRLLRLNNLSLGTLVLSTHFPSLREVLPFVTLFS